MVFPGMARRPASLEEMLQRRKECSPSANNGDERKLDFQPLASDVLISPFPKCGTTWTQHIVHGLRTRGSMDFDEISGVVPWLEMADFLHMDLNAPQPAPRAFKSHLSWNEIPKGGRYICVVRDPRDALVSMYRFLEGFWFEPGTISISSFYHDFLKPWGYWSHLASWWQQRHNEQVLILCYEAMTRDLPGTVRRIAEFIGIELDADLLAIVVRQSSLAFMKAHPRHFDDHLMNEALQKSCGLPPDGDLSKVRKGLVGEYRYELPDEIILELEHLWRAAMEALYGLRTYFDLQVEIERLHSRQRIEICSGR